MSKKLDVHGTLCHGDCCTVMRDTFPAGEARLCIADPPYNLGQAYDAYEDRKTVDQYVDWARNWLSGIWRCLHSHGTLWVFINDGLVSEVDTTAKQLGFHKRNHVIWHYTFGQHHNGNFTASHTHLLYYTKSKSKRTFNADPVRVPSARQVKYKDKRANPKGRTPDNTWVLFPEQLPSGWDPAGDTWLMSRICGTFHEREAHSPNQLPLLIVERILLACSNPGDLVLDPFCGAGTAGVACKRHGRAYFGIDVSQRCIAQSKRRIASV